MEDHLGKVIGKYRLVEHLGSGGMAEVYKAHQASLDRYVAVKLMHAFLAEDAEFRGRFEREAKNIAVMNHPNIVRLHDFDLEGRTYYMVMEFIDGATLKRRIEAASAHGQRLPIPEVINIVKDVGSALAYAHKRGVIHRDVKPANVMLDSAGRVTLTDFGIAKILAGPQYTASGTMVGTPAYMAPEVGLGQPGDARSDIYSLGVMLYQLLTGQLPYDADTPVALVLKHVNDPLPLPRSINPEIPEGLERILLKALTKDPADRYQSVEAMVRDLSDPEAAARMQYPAGVEIIGATARMRTVPRAALAEATLAGQASGAATIAAARPRRAPWVAIGVVSGVIVLGLAGAAVGAGTFDLPAGLFGAPSATPLPTDTPLPTATPILSPTPDLNATTSASIQLTQIAMVTQVAPTATPNLTATALACTYAYTLESTDPADGSTLFVNQPFTLTMTLRNTGACTWPEGAFFALKEGDLLDAEPITPVSPVETGQSGRIEIPMLGPRSVGQVTQVWELRLPNGNVLSEPVTLNYVFAVPATAVPRATATPTPTPTPIATATPEFGPITDLNYSIHSCDYAGDDYICIAQLFVVGGQPPYTVFVEGTRYFFQPGESALIRLRSRRCFAFAWGAQVLDNFGSNFSKSYWFDPGDFASSFPGGACT